MCALFAVIQDGLTHYSVFFGSEYHVVLDRNPGPGYDILLRLIPGDLLNTCPQYKMETILKRTDLVNFFIKRFDFHYQNYVIVTTSMILQTYTYAYIYILV